MSRNLESWKVDRNTKGGLLYIIKADEHRRGDMPVAVVMDNESTETRQEAERNAHLLAAAPDMLRRVYASVEAIEGGVPRLAVNFLREAMALAEGREPPVS